MGCRMRRWPGWTTGFLIGGCEGLLILSLVTRGPEDWRDQILGSEGGGCDLWWFLLGCVSDDGFRAEKRSLHDGQRED